MIHFDSVLASSVMLLSPSVDNHRVILSAIYARISREKAKKAATEGVVTEVISNLTETVTAAMNSTAATLANVTTTAAVEGGVEATKWTAECKRQWMDGWMDR